MAAGARFDAFHFGAIKRPNAREARQPLHFTALVQRLGYLADLLNLPVDAATKASLLAGVGQSTLYLGRTRQWGSGGEHNATWRIVDNIPRRELMAEIEVH